MRVLYLASGGLSHDPPVPVLQGALPRVAEDLIEGHVPTAEHRARGEERVVQAGRNYVAGAATMMPINPDWDNHLLDVLAKGELVQFDSWTAKWMAGQGGWLRP